MTDPRRADPAHTDDRADEPVPRDPPDQQADGGADPLDRPRPGAADEQADEPDTSLPDADESGAGRRGEPRSGSVHPEQPVPDETPG